MNEYTVLFLPEGKVGKARAGQSLLEAASLAGILLPRSCNGKGSCGQCKVRVTSGKVSTKFWGSLSSSEINEGYCLACQTFPVSGVVVEIPHRLPLDESVIELEDTFIEGGSPNLSWELDPANTNHALPGPLFFKKAITVPKPTAEDNCDDLSRLQKELEKQTGIKTHLKSLFVLQNLPRSLRSGNWQVTVSLNDTEGTSAEIVGVESSFEQRTSYGLVLDIGTTTVAALLVELESGKTVASRGTYNRQIVFGDDIISRIIYATDTSGGREELRSAVLATANGLVAGITGGAKINPGDIMAAACAGNTTMTHLFLGIDPAYIRLEPYTPAVGNVPYFTAGEIGLEINPLAVTGFLPCPASYVGGDTVAGVLYTGLFATEKLTLFIDIGTNGEMVLGNKEWLVACACSAGPAFEGGGIRHGMRALPGAIEAVKIEDNGAVKIKTVGGLPPTGICGTGLISTLAALREAGIIDRAGNLTVQRFHDRLKMGDDGPLFVVASSNESGHNEEITISESEIKNLIRTKAAVFAGIRTMLRSVGLKQESIEKVIIAGGFGRYINIKDAVEIGLLPDLPQDRFSFAGNTSLKGAKLYLLSRAAREKAREIAQKITCLELSLGNTFMEEYMAALFLPHTDLKLFPSINSKQ